MYLLAYCSMYIHTCYDYGKITAFSNNCKANEKGVDQCIIN